MFANQVYIKVIFLVETLMDKVHSLILMEELIKVNGLMDCLQVMVFLLGLTVIVIKANISKD